MKYSAVFALSALAVNAAPPLRPYGDDFIADWPGRLPGKFPHNEYSYNNVKCTDYTGVGIIQIPYECVYSAVCDTIAQDSFKRCFPEGQEPKGIISMAKLGKLQFTCRQQAICGYPGEPLDIPRKENEDEIRLIERNPSNSGFYGDETFRDDAEVIEDSGSEVDDLNSTFEGDIGTLPEKDPQEGRFMNATDSISRFYRSAEP